MEKNDPLVQKKAEEANLDYEYVEMMNYIEGDTEFKETDTKDDLPHMSVITLDSGNRLIVKDEMEILIPKCLRKQIEFIPHFSHAAAQSMITQCKGKIFWPSMRRSLQRKYESCKPCQERKASQAMPHNAVGGEDIFSHFFPGQRLQVDYCEKETRTIS